jgi:DNA-binding LacI/PurR family transcriptional regulator
MKTTQEEIARKTNVSQCTVSRVLRGKHNSSVRNETVEKILSTAQEMGYQQRFVPLHAVEHSTKNIGYFIPTLNIRDFTGNSYYARFVSGLTHYSAKNSYRITMYNRYSHLMQAILNNEVDGLVIEARITDSEAEQMKSRIPSVLLNWRTEKMILDSVMPDNVGGIKKVVSYLFSRGHRNIALFGMKPLYLHSEERIRGFVEGMKNCSLEIPPESIQLVSIETWKEEEMVESAFKPLKFWMALKNRPTAVIALGDGSALPLLKTANRLNLKVPDELSVTGFDNTVSCIYSIPSLTSVEQPMEEMAEKALSLLAERINNPDKSVENIVFDVDLIERKSVRDIKGG